METKEVIIKEVLGKCSKCSADIIFLDQEECSECHTPFHFEECMECHLEFPKEIVNCFGYCPDCSKMFWGNFLKDSEEPDEFYAMANWKDPSKRKKTTAKVVGADEGCVVEDEVDAEDYYRDIIKM